MDALNDLLLKTTGKVNSKDMTNLRFMGKNIKYHTKSKICYTWFLVIFYLFSNNNWE